MAKIGLRQHFDMETRNKYTKIDCEVGMNIDGKELPSMAVLGAALEEATALIQLRVAESYKEIPARVASVTTNDNTAPQVSKPAQAEEVAVVTPEPEVAVPFGAAKPWDLR
jgi:hypothetical protein